MGEPPVPNEPAGTGVDSASIRLAVAELHAEFADRLDRHRGERVHELFATDGQYVVDGVPLQGADAIRQAYQERAARGPRTTRHLFINLRIDSLGDAECRCSTVMLLYGADGVPPLPLTEPLLLADVFDELVLTDAGWRFHRRELVPIFRGTAELRPPQSAVQQKG